MGGCGCKNKQNQTANQTQKPQQSNTPNVQESIKKVVEKYYNKK